MPVVSPLCSPLLVCQGCRLDFQMHETPSTLHHLLAALQAIYAYVTLMDGNK